MNGEQIIALEVEAKAAHRAYLQAAALLDPPTNVGALARQARVLLNALQTALQEYKGDD